MPQVSTPPSLLPFSTPADSDPVAERSVTAAAVMGALRDGIVVLSPDWQLVFVNPAAEEILGRPGRELLGTDHWAAFPHTRGTEMERMYRRAMADREPVDFEHYSTHLGRWFWLKLHPSTLGLTICFHDITARKRAQAEEQMSAERFRLAAANEHFTLYEQDRELRYTWLYPLHREHEHALGRTDAELHPDGVAGDLVALKQGVLASGREARHEVVARLPSGVRYYDLFVRPRRNAAGEIIGVGGVALDITERKKGQDAMRENEQRLRTMIEHAPVGIAETDLTGRILSVNSGFGRQLGYTADEMVGRNVAEFTHPDDVELSRSQRENMARHGGAHYSIEKRYLRRNGETLWAQLTVSFIRDEAGQPKRCLGIVEDISERKEASQRQLLLFRLVSAVNRAGEIDAIFDAALEALCRSQRCERAAILLRDRQGVMRFTAHRGLSESYRRAVEGHSPWRPDEADPQPVCIADVDAAALEAPLRAVVLGEGIRALAFIPLTYEGRLLGKFMAYYDAPHAFVPDDLQAAQTIASQVSFGIARLQAAAQLEELVASRTASLQAALQQMEEFSYTVSHDLRAPARSMMSYIEVIRQDHGAALPGEVVSHLERIHRNARRMDALVRDTLAYSRAARMECPLNRISLDQVVADAIAGLPDPAARAAISVVSPLGEVWGNELCLAQAVSNLIDNALKFVRPGIPARISVRSTSAGHRLRVLVEDNGVGVPEELQPRLFRMFERLHGADYEGTGIGLAIVRKVVERMQGTVGVISARGTGSTFWFEVDRPPA